MTDTTRFYALTDEEAATIRAVLLITAERHSVLASKLQSYDDSPNRTRMMTRIAEFAQEEDIADYIIDGAPSLSTLTNRQLTDMIKDMIGKGE